MVLGKCVYGKIRVSLGERTNSKNIKVQYTGSTTTDNEFLRLFFVTPHVHNGPTYGFARVSPFDQPISYHCWFLPMFRD